MKFWRWLKAYFSLDIHLDGLESDLKKAREQGYPVDDLEREVAEVRRKLEEIRRKK